MSGWPWISWRRIGKSARSATGSSGGASARGAAPPGLGAGRRLGLDRHPGGLRQRPTAAGSAGRPPVALVVAGRGLRDEERLVGHVRLEPGVAEDRAVALVLEPEGQVLAAALDDPALGEDVDEVRGDVVQQPLVVGDQEDAELRVEHRVDALGDDPQRVDVEARVRLVEDRDLRLEDGHLEHLQPLLLAAAEALVDVPRRERLVHLQEGHLLAHLRPEVAHADPALHRVGRVDVAGLVDALELRVERAPDEAGDAQAGDRGRVLEGEEHPEAGPLVGAQLQDVAALPRDLAAGHDIGRVAHQRVGERRLARAVRAHDRVDLALADVEVDPLEDLRPWGWRWARPGGRG